MRTRKGTPGDVMGAVLTGDSTPAKQPDSIRQHDSKPVKVTIYLPPDVAAMLDRAWAERRLAGEPTTKSAIVADALAAQLKR